VLAIQYGARFGSSGRHELCDIRTLRRKFWRRLCGFCAWAVGSDSKARGLRFDSVNLDQVRIIDAEDGQDDQSGDGQDGQSGDGRVVDTAGPSGITGESVPYERMD